MYAMQWTLILFVLEYVNIHIFILIIGKNDDYDTCRIYSVAIKLSILAKIIFSLFLK